jgi:exodeoxyribonuclease VII small subunit
MAKENINYTDAFDELQQIVSEMENADITVDELSEKIKRCTMLIKLCKDKLTKTEAEISKIMEKED